MYFLLIQAQIFILFYSVLNYLLFSVQLQISDQIFYFGLTVAFMTIPHNLTPRLLKINGMTTG
jgi:hypothetical protein